MVQAVIRHMEEIGWKQKNGITPDTPFQAVIDRFLYLGLAPLDDIQTCFDNMVIELSGFF